LVVFLLRHGLHHCRFGDPDMSFPYISGHDAEQALKAFTKRQKAATLRDLMEARTHCGRGSAELSDITSIIETTIKELNHG
jgi:ERCC4-type nuclease